MQNSPTAQSNAAFLHSAFFLLPWLARRALVLIVRVYQLALSPAKNLLLGPSSRCRFEPSCSQYAIEAVKIHGALGGGWLAAKRICRCHPWGKWGKDPVPPIKPKSPPADLRISDFGSRI